MEQEYWLKKDADEVIKKMEPWHGNWSIWGSNPIMQAWVRNSISYYSAILEPGAWDSSLSYDGEQGELVRMLVPSARRLIRQLVTIITKQKLNFSALARTDGTDVIKEVRLGNSLAQQITEDQNYDYKLDKMVEQGLVYGNSYLKTCWRTDKGEPYTRSNNDGLILSGDVEITVPSVFDVFYDYNVEDWEHLDWVEVRTTKNKWDLIAQFPDLKDAILQLPCVRDWRTSHDAGQMMTTEDDFIFCYELFVKPSASLPKGRMIFYGDKNTIFFDGINKYNKIPIEMYKPENIFGMGFGYPLFSDLMPIQEMLDHSFSAVATNQAAFAVQNITVARGSGINVQEISGGLNFLMYDPQNIPGGGKPEPLNLTQSSPETFKFIEMLREYQMELSGVVGALRGNPPPGVTSGTAIATVTTNALEFLSAGSKAYVDTAEKGMMNAINAYRRFASQERIVRMAGRNGMHYTRKFVGSDLDPIQNVRLNVANPLMQTIAGRTEVAEKMLQSGMIKSMQEYFSIVDGAPTSQMMETELSENDLIQAENESLMLGQEVIILATDDHPMHIRKHHALLNDPILRHNNSMVAKVLDHIMEHSQLARQTDPMLQAMVRTGQMPQQPQQAPQQQLPPPQGAQEPQQDQLGMSDIGGQPTQDIAEPAEDLLGR